MRIREIDPDGDAAAIAAIYAPYVANTDITFETVAPTPMEMAQRLRTLTAAVPGFVAEDADGTVEGYCYAHPWKSFSAYSVTLETTVYVAPGHFRRGVGRALMERLIAECRNRGARVLIACITAGNDASVALHRALGFTKASHFVGVGCKAGRYIDVEDYQLSLAD